MKSSHQSPDRIEFIPGVKPLSDWGSITAIPFEQLTTDTERGTLVLEVCGLSTVRIMEERKRFALGELNPRSVVIVRGVDGERIAFIHQSS